MNDAARARPNAIRRRARTATVARQIAALAMLAAPLLINAAGAVAPPAVPHAAMPPAVATAAPLSATAPAVADSPAVAYGRDPAAVRRGRLIFIGSCGAYCHALHGGTRGDVPDLFDCQWLHGGMDADIFHTVATGVPGTRMVGFKEALPEKDTDVWKVVAFLRANSNCKQP